MKGIRRINKTLEVYTSGQVLPIDFRLPSDLKECLGMQAMVVGLIPTGRSVIPNFGEYALEFGAKKAHPINFIVPYANRSFLKSKQGIIPLGVSLDNSPVLTGFYRDLAEQDLKDREFTPYKVRFTFHCKNK